MWLWLIIILISLACLFCFISVIQLELRKRSAKLWIILTCCSIGGVVAALVSAPSPDIQEYSYHSKPPNIKIVETTPKDTSSDDGIKKGKKVVVTAVELYVRASTDPDARILGSVNYGNILTVLDAPADLDLVNIQTGYGLTGWVLKRHVQALPEEKIPEQALPGEAAQ
ncbi:SH3 domain-containing protein [Desulfolucanica intricata]|uniref:SH3 domain-containing protein n=1 Tax=Desulfolucanica intricata TaxID=1285191 RepID=UPI00082E9061|nr:SH3 domain-containing protein [Desulfolucanica intricata]